MNDKDPFTKAARRYSRTIKQISLCVDIQKHDDEGTQNAKSGPLKSWLC